VVCKFTWTTFQAYFKYNHVFGISQGFPGVIFRGEKVLMAIFTGGLAVKQRLLQLEQGSQNLFKM